MHLVVNSRNKLQIRLAPAAQRVAAFNIFSPISIWASYQKEHQGVVHLSIAHTKIHPIMNKGLTDPSQKITLIKIGWICKTRIKGCSVWTLYIHGNQRENGMLSSSFPHLAFAHAEYVQCNVAFKSKLTLKAKNLSKKCTNGNSKL